jgi:hypothetical protein
MVLIPCMNKTGFPSEIDLKFRRLNSRFELEKKGTAL